MKRNEATSVWMPAVVAAGCLLVAQPSMATPAPDPGPQTCLGWFQQANLADRLACLQGLKGARVAASAAIRPLCDIVAGGDGATDHLLIAAVLDVLRSLGSGAAPAAETLSGLLPHRCKLYSGRDEILVVRLRAYIVLTLSEIGFPSSALPTLLDTLAHQDDRMLPLELGAAVRAVGSLGPRGRQLAPYLLDTLDRRLSAEEFSLARYEPVFPPEEATTVQLEAVRSLALICSAEDRQVVAVLQQLARKDGCKGCDPRVAPEAERALKLILSPGDRVGARREERP